MTLGNSIQLQFGNGKLSIAYHGLETLLHI